MLGRIDCTACEGYGEVEVDIVGGGTAEIDCPACGGAGGWDICGPPTAEQAAEIDAREAKREANAAKWVPFVCTHCDSYCDAHVDRGPSTCRRCDAGVLVPLRELQALARVALPWRRNGDTIVTVEPPDPRQGVLFGCDQA